MSVFNRLLWATALLALFIVGAQWLLLRNGIVVPFRMPAALPQPPLTRPYGMAPAAFDGFVRACYRAHIHPRRISQTIGDHPLSVGYHHRDGTIEYQGKALDYTAAVDIGTQDLTRPQIDNFLEELARQGFAAFYREKGKWKGGEHIHAIYAPLQMKPQLRGQLEEWARKRWRQKKPVYRWQKREGLTR